MLAREDRGGRVKDVEYELASEHRQRIHAMGELGVVVVAGAANNVVVGEGAAKPRAVNSSSCLPASTIARRARAA